MRPRRSVPNAARVGTEAPSAAERSWEIKMLYDGDCPLCMREVNMLRRRDAENGKIEFVDVASPDYDPSAHAGISFKQVSHVAAGSGTQAYVGPTGHCAVR